MQHYMVSLGQRMLQVKTLLDLQYSKDGSGFGSTAIILALTPLVTSAVILTEEAHGYLTGMMVIMVFYMIGRCVNTVTINGVMDGGAVLAVYSCTCLDEVGKIPWVMIRFRKYKWVQDLTR